METLLPPNLKLVLSFILSVLNRNTIGSTKATRLYLIRIAVVLISIQTIKATTYYSRATGNWNNASTWSTASLGGAAAGAYPGQAAGDIVIISGYTITANVTPTFSVTSIDMNQTNNTGNDTKLNINTAGIILTCGALTVADNNLGKDMELNVASTATLQVNGNVTCTRITTNNQSNRIRFYISSNGRMNVTGGFTYTYNRGGNSEADKEIWLDNSGRLDITGALTAVIGNNAGSNNAFNLQMDNTSVCNIGSVSLTISNSSDGDDIKFNINGGTLTVNSTWQETIATTASSANSISMYLDGGTLHCTGAMTCNQNGGGNGDLSFFINQTSTVTASNLTVDGKVSFSHTDGDNMEIENNANGTINFNDSLTVDLSGGSSGDRVYVDLNGGTMTITKGFRSNVLSNNNYMDMQLDGGTLNANGGIIYNQSGTGSGDMFIYLNSNVTTNPSVLTIGGSGLTFNDNGGDNMDLKIYPNSTLTVNGNLTMNNNTASGNDRNMIYTGIGTPAPIVSITGNLNCNLNTGTSVNDQEFLDINAGTFTVEGNLSTLTSTACTGGAKCYLEIDGNSTLFNVGGTLTMNHLGGTTANANDYIDIGNNSGSPILNLGGLTLNHQAGNTTKFKQWNSSIVTVNGNITLTASAASKLSVELNSTSILQLTGNFIRQATPNRFGSLTTGGSTYIKYIGSISSQTIAGNAGSGADNFTFNNMEINNTYSISPQLIMTATEGNVTLANGGNLTLTKGIISSQTSAMLVINNNSTSDPGNANCYINGPMKKVGDQPNAFVFPVGSTGIGWARLGISNYSQTEATTEFVCQHFSAPSPSNTLVYMGSSVGTALDHVSKAEYWTLDRVVDPGNNGKCNVTLYWENATNSGITTATDLRVGHLDISGTNKWENHGQGSLSFGASGNIKTAVVLSTFSPITFGSQANLNVLPIGLIDFTAVCGTNEVHLNWSTESEFNNDYFLIEKSNNAVEWDALAKVNGSGNSNTKINYIHIDFEKTDDLVYYRLSKVDHDQKITIFKTIDITCNSVVPDQMILFSNPASTEMNIVLNVSKSVSNGTMRLVDNTGGTIMETKIDLIQGINAFTFPINAGTGIYHILFSSDDLTIPSQQIVVIKP